MRQTEFFVIWAIFFPFIPPSLPKWSRKLKSWKKWKKCLEILSFYTYMCTVNEDHMIYGFWNIMCDRQKFLSFWAIFLPFQPLDKLENQNFNIEKKIPGDIIILHIWTINDNHMMYGSWDREHDRHKFLSFWTIFCPFTPLWKKIKIWKKRKKHLSILSF